MTCIKSKNGAGADFNVECGLHVTRCLSMQKEHRRSLRQYAHVFHVPRQICIARDLEDLPAQIGLAILLHEVGHLLAGPDKGERVANNTIERYSGIHIYYEDSDYGSNLEIIEQCHISTARKILRGLIKSGITI